MLKWIEATDYPVLFTLVELTVVAFTVMGIPIQQINKGGTWPGKKPCYTLWGFKSDCGSVKYDTTGLLTWECAHRHNVMTLACISAVASAAMSLLLVLIGALMVCNCSKHYLLPAALSTIVAVMLLVCWACIASVYTSKMCGGSNYSGSRLRDGGNTYAVGFVVLVIAWCLQVVNGVGLFYAYFFF